MPRLRTCASSGTLNDEDLLSFDFAGECAAAAASAAEETEAKRVLEEERQKKAEAEKKQRQLNERGSDDSGRDFADNERCGSGELELRQLRLCGVHDIQVANGKGTFTLCSALWPVRVLNKIDPLSGGSVKYVTSHGWWPLPKDKVIVAFICSGGEANWSLALIPRRELLPFNDKVLEKVESQLKKKRSGPKFWKQKMWRNRLARAISAAKDILKSARSRDDAEMAEVSQDGPAIIPSPSKDGDTDDDFSAEEVVYSQRSVLSSMSVDVHCTASRNASRGASEPLRPGDRVQYVDSTKDSLHRVQTSTVIRIEKLKVPRPKLHIVLDSGYPVEQHTQIKRVWDSQRKRDLEPTRGRHDWRDASEFTPICGMFSLNKRGKTAEDALFENIASALKTFDPECADAVTHSNAKSRKRKKRRRAR